MTLVETTSNPPVALVSRARRRGQPQMAKTEAHCYLTFNNLLILADMDPAEVLVLRHRPPDDRLYHLLPQLAAEEPDVFNAYQQTQSKPLEQAMTKARYIAAFIAQDARKAVFVGLYAIGGHSQLTEEVFWQDQAHKKLAELGMSGFKATQKRSTIARFDLRYTDFCADWKGRLVVAWPSHPRPFWRYADRCGFPVVAIHEEAAWHLG